MLTTIAYSANVDTGGNLAYLPGIPDQHVRVEGINIVVPEGMNNLLGVYFIGPNITQARVESPSLRRTVLLDVSTLERSATPQDIPRYLTFFYNPIPLDNFEILRVLAAEDAAGGSQMTAILWIGDGAQSPTGGEIYTVEARSSVTLVPFQWTPAAVSFTQTLPAGTYQVVGFQAQSAGLIAARLVFVGGTWRPGVIGRTSPFQPNLEYFRRGALGVLGEFRHDQPPVVEYLSSSADTSQRVWFDLIKTG